MTGTAAPPAPESATYKSSLTSSKKAPCYSSLPLEGLTFVFTGILETMSRDEAKDLARSKGAKVTGAVSGRTDYLVGGPVLDKDGRKLEEGAKYRDAIERGVNVIRGEDAFLAFIDNRATTSIPSAATNTGKASPPLPSPARSATSGKLGPRSEGTNQEQRGAKMNPLWADKYAPMSVREVLGNGEVVKKLRDWLGSWVKVHLGPVDMRKKVMPSRENPGAKAVLISGPPGIGKTSIATLVAQEMDYEILELNASDTRSKNSLQVILSAALESPMLRLGAQSGHNESSVMKKRLVIMDEVDGLSGSDRGGSQELIKLIKTAKVPVVCICNDRQSVKVKGLANSCFDLRAKRPMKQAIAKRLVTIAAKEGISLENNAAELLAEKCGNDIRQCLNALQMWAADLHVGCQEARHTAGHVSSSLSFGATYSLMKERLKGRIEKDAVLRFTPFDATRMILSDYDRKSLSERNEAFFVDHGIAPLLVWENYVATATNPVVPTIKEDKMGRVVDAAETLSLSDLIDRKARGEQNWSLLTTQAALIVKVGIDLKGRCVSPTFPRWFGKNSTRTKNARLSAILALHIGHRVSASQHAIRLDYLGPLFYHVAAPLVGLEDVKDPPGLRPKDDHGEGYDVDDMRCTEAIRRLDEYSLSRDDLFETLNDLTLDQSIISIGKLNSKIKTKFTKAYNSANHPAHALYTGSVEAIKQKRKRDEKTEYGHDHDDDDEELEEKEADILSRFAKKCRGSGSSRSKPVARKPGMKKPVATSNANNTRMF
mmetsp:Transcript_37669/g.120845  ORF Transcript_37669/g.120845 Transcript_37669/m.120845 type:complete len:770 (+) Transcript_37669:188-2497(+)